MYFIRSTILLFAILVFSQLVNAQSTKDIKPISDNADAFFTPVQFLSELGLQVSKRNEWYRLYKRTNDKRPTIAFDEFRWEAKDELNARIWFARNSLMFSEGGVEISDVITMPYPYFNFNVYIPTDSQIKKHAKTWGVELEHYSFAWKVDKYVGLLRITLVQGSGIGKALDIVQSGFSATLKASGRDDAKIWLTSDAKKKLLADFDPREKLGVGVTGSKFDSQLGVCAYDKKFIQNHMILEMNELGYIATHGYKTSNNIGIVITGRQEQGGTCTGTVRVQISGSVENVRATLPLGTSYGTYIGSSGGETGVSPEIFLQSILGAVSQSAGKFHQLYIQELATKADTKS